VKESANTRTERGMDCCIRGASVSGVQFRRRWEMWLMIALPGRDGQGDGREDVLAVWLERERAEM